MSYQTHRDDGAAPARITMRVLRIWRVWVIAAAIVAIVIVPVGFEIAIHLVPPDAVRVTASSITDGHVLFTHEITNRHVVADLYARINNLPFPTPAQEGQYNCPANGPMTYDFSFTRWGIVIEDAEPGVGCVFLWTISRGGIPETRIGSVGDTVAILTEAQLPQ